MGNVQIFDRGNCPDPTNTDGQAAGGSPGELSTAGGTWRVSAQRGRRAAGRPGLIPFSDVVLDGLVGRTMPAGSLVTSRGARRGRGPGGGRAGRELMAGRVVPPKGLCLTGLISRHKECVCVCVCQHCPVEGF